MADDDLMMQLSKVSTGPIIDLVAPFTSKD